MERIVKSDERGLYVSQSGIKFRLPAESEQTWAHGDRVDITALAGDERFGIDVAWQTEGLSIALVPDEPEGGDEDTAPGVEAAADRIGAALAEAAVDATPPAPPCAFAPGDVVPPGELAPESAKAHRALLGRQSVTLPRRLTPEEMADLQRQLAEASDALRRHDEEAKAARALLVAKRKVIHDGWKGLSTEHERGTRVEPVEVEDWALYDRPVEVGGPAKIRVRMDTREVISVSPLAEEDRQLELTPIKGGLSESQTDGSEATVTAEEVGGKRVVIKLRRNVDRIKTVGELATVWDELDAVDRAGWWTPTADRDEDAYPIANLTRRDDDAVDLAFRPMPGTEDDGPHLGRLPASEPVERRVYIDDLPQGLNAGMVLRLWTVLAGDVEVGLEDGGLPVEDVSPGPVGAVRLYIDGKPVDVPEETGLYAWEGGADEEPAFDEGEEPDAQDLA